MSIISARASSDSSAAATSAPLELTEQRLAVPALQMAAGTALSRLTGLGRLVAMTFAVGVAESRLADSYNLANTLPNVVYELVLGGVLTSVFLPLVVEQLRTQDEEDAWRAISALVSASLLVLLVMTALTALLAPLIVGVFSARVSGAEGPRQHALASFFLLIFAPQIALYGLVAIGDGLLNARGRFALPAFAPILNNVIVIATFLVFAAVAAGIPTNASVESSLGLKLLLALGTTGGVAAMAAVYLPALRALPLRLSLRGLGHPAVRRLARLSGWTVLYVVTNVAGLLVSFYLANGRQGGPTAYVTAFAFFQLPIGVAAISVITALTPKLAAHHVDQDRVAFRAQMAAAMRLTAVLMLPATAAYLVLATPVVQTLLAHGIASSASTALVAGVLRFFALGLFPFAAFQLLMRGFYATQDARSPALINVFENGATVALDLLLFAVLRVRGLALAHSLGYFIGCGIALWLLARRGRAFADLDTALELAKTVLASALVAGAIAAVVWIIGTLGLSSGSQALWQSLVGSAAGLAVFVVAARILRIRDALRLGEQLSNLARRRRKTR